MRPVVFIGLDIESSGSNPLIHVPIQVGVAGPQRFGQDQFLFTADIGWQEWVEDLQATLIHGFSRERVMAGEPLANVDLRLRALLDLLNPKGRCIPVGWNVGSFDVNFLRHHGMTFTVEKLGYQSVDLNALVFTIAIARRDTFGAVKTMAKEYAERALLDEGVRPQHHDALYDARAALKSWEFLTALVRHPKFEKKEP